MGSLAWAGSEYALERMLDRTTAELQRAGLHLSFARRHLAGWPASASLALDDVQLENTASGGVSARNQTLHWTAQRLVLQASLLHPLSVALIGSGVQRLHVGPLPEATFWGERVALYLPWSPRLPLAIPIEARALHAATDGSGPDWITTIAEAGGHLRLAAGGNLAIRLELDGITLPQAGPHPLGRVVDRLSLTAALPPGLGVATWPDRQPMLVQHASLDWASLHAAASGRLYLDPPSGQLSLDLRGVRAALRDAARDGDLAQGVASALNGLAGLLEQARDQGRGGAADDTLSSLPLRLHDGTLYLDAIPLWRIGTAAPFSLE